MTEIEWVVAGPQHRHFVRELSRDAFARFGDYARLLPPLLDLPSTRGFVAVASNVPVGFMLCSLEDAEVGEVDLVAIAVAPAWQQHGIGLELLRRAEREALALGVEHPVLRLTVAEDNARARRVFARFGFVESGGGSGFYAGGQRSLEMRKDLSAP